MERPIKYTAIPGSGSNSETENQLEYSNFKSSKIRRHFVLSRTLCLILCTGLLMAFVIIIAISQGYARQPISQSSTCVAPIIRREWRTFTKAEKQEYFRAVNCLQTKPSRLGTKHPLYNDFAFLHQRTNGEIHDAAGFLAWHRYFIHLYEQALQKECEYAGHLAYWNWELDWEDISKSPVWDSEDGFGGDGTGDEFHGIGRCVTDGPFANMPISYIDIHEIEHCLLRNFRLDTSKEERVTSKLHPDRLQEIFGHQDFESFTHLLENGVHLAIPTFVRGDFLSFTAPNDPVFFLHHTQLDRLWWKWQRINPETRLKGYGKADPSEEALVKNVLHMGALGPAVTVSEVLSTETDLLCYTY